MPITLLGTRDRQGVRISDPAITSASETIYNNTMQVYVSTSEKDVRTARKLYFTIRDPKEGNYPEYYVFFNGDNNYELTKVINANDTKEPMTSEDLIFFQQVIRNCDLVPELRKRFIATLPALEKLVKIEMPEIENIHDLNTLPPDQLGVSITIGGKAPRNFWVDFNANDFSVTTHPSTTLFDGHTPLEYELRTHHPKDPGKVHVLCGERKRKPTQNEFKLVTRIIEGLGTKNQARFMFLARILPIKESLDK